MKKILSAGIVFFFVSFLASAFSEKDIISPARGQWCNQQVLVLDSSSALELYYSFSGTDPFVSGFAYDGPVLIEKNDTSSKLAKLKNHRTVYKTWKKIVGDLKSGDQLYVQFPVLEHSLFLHKVFNKLNKSGVEVILIIHDLELLQQRTCC